MSLDFSQNGVTEFDEQHFFNTKKNHQHLELDFNILAGSFSRALVHWTDHLPRRSC